MLDRTDYALSDFLLFSARVYHRMFELHNAALWPVHVVALLAGFFLVAVVLRPSRRGARRSFAVLAVAWAFVGWLFFLERYATINWAAAYIAPLFGAQAVFFGFMAARPDVVELTRRGVVVRALVLGVLLMSLIGYPLVAVLLGRPWWAAEVFAVAPDPTVTATLALLAVGRGAGVVLASVIPLVWVVITTLKLYTLASAEFFVAPLAATLCVVAWAIGRFQRLA
ncbi:MAG: DUF6064 family protein [Hyphomicrobiaceae bacterium]